MPRKKQPINYIAILKNMAQNGIDTPPNQQPTDTKGELPPLNERIDRILNTINNRKRPAGQMLFFVMYDIESDKTRRLVVKYLENKGCTRIQKSIFLADLPMDKYQAIRDDLTEVQAAYNNNDSILVVPITTDYLRAMKIIGQNINVDIITHTKNTMFF
ncbi:MAG: CRISPR-associated endonuclease Cas2 [Paludibacteraceae bacterium]|nr:CRISPR-associated endonuclease Cas2 [Paludibacteraceae bacterium]